MITKSDSGASTQIPAYALYGENLVFPDVLHCERVTDRAEKHDWRISPHRHVSLHQFFLGLSGQMSISLDGQKHTIPPCTLISIPRLTVHGFAFEKGTQGFVLTIPIHELPDVFGQNSSLSPVLADWLMLPASRQIVDLVSDIHTEHQTHSAARNPMLRALATQLACLIIKDTSGDDDYSGAPTKIRHQMVRFEALVREHMAMHLRVCDYAKMLGVSATHLNRVCRFATGGSALKFVESAVFEEARRLLAYTRSDISEISYRLGFEDPSYFSRAFRRNTDLSPKEYRERLMNLEG